MLIISGVIFSLSSIHNIAYANLIPNPGCETNTSSWNSYQGTLTRVTNVAHSGSASCLVTRSVGDYYTIDDNQDPITNPPVGKTYTATAWVRSTTAVGKPIHIILRQWTGSNKTMTSGPIVNLTTDWQKITATVTVTSAVDSIDYYIVQDSAVSGNSFYVDDMELIDAATVTPTPGSRQNLVQNWSYELGTTDWFLQKKGSANGTFTATNATSTHGAYSAQIVVTTTTSNLQDLELATYGVPVSAGKTYTLSFWAKASGNRTMDAIVQNGNDPYTLYTRKTASLTSSWQQYTYTFQPTETTDNALVGFQVATATGTVWIDDVQLYEGTPSSTLPANTLIKAVNFNGPQLDVDGTTFQAQSAAGITTNGTNFQNQGITLSPSVSANKAQMLRSSIWRGGNIQLNAEIPITNGEYSVYVYTWEDTTSTTYNIGFEGVAKESNLQSGNAGTWKKLGPYHVTVSDGSLSFFQTGGDFNLSGIEVYTSDGISAEEPTIDWWDPKWLSRKKITINNTASAESLVNFPLRVSLNSTNVDYAKTQNLGQDVRFVDADGVTLLAHEIEKWDENGTSDLWVKVPQIDANSNADYIWMYYNNSNAADGQNKANVWSNGYAAVYHMAETSGTTVIDSTSNANNGTASGFTLSTNAGRIGNAQNFDGGTSGNDKITIPNSSSLQDLTEANFTYTAWANPDTNPNSSGLNDYFVVGKRGQHTGLRFASGSNWFSTVYNTSGTAYGASASPYTSGTWRHVAETVDTATKRENLYVDGALRNGNTYTGTLRDYGTQASSIGQADINGACSADYAWCFDGKIDEVRMARVARSADWIEAEYASGLNNMNTFGNEESRTGTVTTLPGDISNLNYYLTNFNPWMQVQCGELRMDNGIDNPVPEGKTMMTSNPTCSTPGVIFTGDSQAEFGVGQASSTNQVVGGYSYPEVYVPSNSGGIFSSYDYLSAKVKASDTTPTNLSTICTLSNCTLPVTLPQGTYTATGDVSLNGFTFPANQHYVFIINGNLTIKGNIVTPVGSTVVFSVSGNIIVPPTVGSAPSSSTTNLAGIFSTDKSFIMQSTNTCADLRLNIAGVLIVNAAQSGGKLQNNRDLCGNNLDNPSLQIVQRLDFVVNLPELVRIQSITSNEVAP